MQMGAIAGWVAVGVAVTVVPVAHDVEVHQPSKGH